MELKLEYDELLRCANDKVILGNELIKTLEKFKDTPGVAKVQRQIKTEIKVFVKLIQSNRLKLMHVQCSNLRHFEFLVQILLQQHQVIHIDCGFSMGERENPLRVDIVCDNGLKWIKVIARNSKSLNEAALDAAGYGVRSILDQAHEFIDAAAQHLCMFKPPKVLFCFSQTIDGAILEKLQKIGIETTTFDQHTPSAGKIVEVVDLANVNTTLNLDITTLLAYISALCNDSCHWTFKEAILTELAQNERRSPLKPTLNQLFYGKRLVCCKIAEQCFRDIVSLLAGPKEQQRAAQLMDRVEVFDDVKKIPAELSEIRLSGKINERSLKIFAFGMYMKAPTVTSNRSFIRSAKMQGINIPVFEHQARALTESKESTATPLL